VARHPAWACAHQLSAFPLSRTKKDNSPTPAPCSCPSALTRAALRSLFTRYTHCCAALLHCCARLSARKTLLLLTSAYIQGPTLREGRRAVAFTLGNHHLHQPSTCHCSATPTSTSSSPVQLAVRSLAHSAAPSPLHSGNQSILPTTTFALPLTRHLTTLVCTPAPTRLFACSCSFRFLLSTQRPGCSSTAWSNCKVRTSPNKTFCVVSRFRRLAAAANTPTCYLRHVLLPEKHTTTSVLTMCSII
jgi:hypothetical protein